MRSVSVRLDDLRTMSLNIGFVGENEHRRFIIDCKKMYDEYPHAAVSMTIQPPEGDAYPAIVERDGDFVIWDVTDSDLAYEGDGELQLAFTAEPHVAKSYIARTNISRSIIPTGEVPSGIDDFLTRAGAALTAIPETIDAALEEAKESGEFDGPPGPQGPKGDKGDKGDPGTPAENIVPLFSFNNGTLSCNMTFAEVYAAVSNKQCTSCMMGSYANGQGYLLKSSSSFGVSFTRSGTNKNAGQVSETEICLYPDESVQLTPEVVNVSDVIGDTSGTGVTNKAWSANKLTSEFDLKAPKANPVFTESISMGRKSGTTVGTNSTAFGDSVQATADNAHAEGGGARATAIYAHAEGGGTLASGAGSHAEGQGAAASGDCSHAEGGGTVAIGRNSHAEGNDTVANNLSAHAEGGRTLASGAQSHAEGVGTTASGDYSHAEGYQTIANHKSQHVFGELNIADDSSETGANRGNYVEIVGNGTASNARSNARTLDWDGNEELAGDLTIKKGSADEVSVSELAEDVGDLKSAIERKQNSLNLSIVDGKICITYEEATV